VDADGAEDNHVIAAQTARLGAVVALRALDNCTRLARDRSSSCPPRPQPLLGSGVLRDFGRRAHLQPERSTGELSVQAIGGDEVADDRAVVDRIAIPLARVRLGMDCKWLVREANARPTQVRNDSRLGD
jgi:hypothetical protein